MLSFVFLEISVGIEDPVIRRMILFVFLLILILIFLGIPEDLKEN